MKIGKNKVYTFCVIFFILFGLFMVLTKGFEVDVDLKQHDVLRFKFSQKFEKQDVEKVCNQILEDKEYEIKTVEVFSDSVYIMSPKITEKEKNRLIESLGNLYVKNVEGQDNTKKLEDFVEGDDYRFYTDAKVRLRDLVMPYIIPSVISGVIILIYIGIKYRKINNGKIYRTVFEVAVEGLLLVFALAGAIATSRFPVNRMIIPILIFVVISWLIFKCCDFEKELKNVEE